jgi:hypothetical protein
MVGGDDNPFIVLTETKFKGVLEDLTSRGEQKGFGFDRV